MADNINGINNYGYGFGYVPQRKGNEDNSSQQTGENVANNYESTQVDPNTVMDFLSNNNYFIDLVNVPKPINGIVPDPTLADRIDGYMQNFETIFAIVEKEFGSELAPQVMDFAMDRLMGMVD